MKTVHIIVLCMFLIAPASMAWSFTFNLAPQKLPFSVSDVGFTSGGKQHSMPETKGQKRMLWLFSTWCHTCVASVRAMQDKQSLWEKTGVLILALRNYDNGGSAGLDMPAFMQKIAPKIRDFNNWILGEATLQMDQKLNAKKFPDIYFLVDENGWVQKVGTAPNISMKTIIRFAQGAVAKK